MPFITIRVKARKYPVWQYIAAVMIAIVNASFFAWFAYSCGLGLWMARQVLFVFGGLQLLLIPSLYFANERRFHDHNSKAVQGVAAVFAGLMCFAVIYFLAAHDITNGEDSTTILFAVLISIASIVTGILFALFGIRYEVE